MTRNGSVIDRRALTVSIVAALAVAVAIPHVVDSRTKAARIEQARQLTITVQNVLSGGDDDSCAVTSSGHVDCWGIGYYGQLGNGSHLRSATPVQVSGLSGVTQVTNGDSVNCALESNGSVWCWGSGGYGQLGNDTFTPAAFTPVAVVGIRDARQVSAGYGFVCALLATGTVDCWGDGYEGQLGNGNSTPQDKPVPVSGLSGVKEVASGGYHACALLTVGEVECWGEGSFGQTGAMDGATELRPVEVSGTSVMTQIAAGGAHTCGVTSSG
ncbi:MAG TPA: hypothetical protein VED63_02335, partial [Acidimicrobiales bacterium]|nr:hypothetical protein [Acidimicrobiales bacterium]